MAIIRQADEGSILLLPGEDTIHFFTVLKNVLAAEYTADGDLLLYVTDGERCWWADSTEGIPVDARRNNIKPQGPEVPGAKITSLKTTEQRQPPLPHPDSTPPAAGA